MRTNIATNETVNRQKVVSSVEAKALAKGRDPATDVVIDDSASVGGFFE